MTKPKPPHELKRARYMRPLTADEVAYLRSLVPCEVCRGPLVPVKGRRQPRYQHQQACPVQHRVEDEDGVRPRRKSKGSAAA